MENGSNCKLTEPAWIRSPFPKTTIPKTSSLVAAVLRLSIPNGLQRVAVVTQLARDMEFTSSTLEMRRPFSRRHIRMRERGENGIKERCEGPIDRPACKTH